MSQHTKGEQWIVEVCIEYRSITRDEAEALTTTAENPHAAARFRVSIVSDRSSDACHLAEQWARSAPAPDHNPMTAASVTSVRIVGSFPGHVSESRPEWCIRL